MQIPGRETDLFGHVVEDGCSHSPVDGYFVLTAGDINNLSDGHFFCFHVFLSSVVALTFAMDANLQTEPNFIKLDDILRMPQTVKSVACLSAETRLFQLIDPLCGLDSHLKGAQDASHNVDGGVRSLGGGADVTDMSAGVVEHEGFHKVGGDALSELRGDVKIVSPREAIELLKGQI